MNKAQNEAGLTADSSPEDIGFFCDSLVTSYALRVDLRPKGKATLENIKHENGEALRKLVVETLDGFAEDDDLGPASNSKEMIEKVKAHFHLCAPVMIANPGG